MPRRPRRTAHLAGAFFTASILIASAGCSSQTADTDNQTPAPQAIAAVPSSSTTATATSASAALSSEAADSLIAAAGPATALAVLGTLVAKDATEAAGYDAAAFGAEWADTDNNGCNTWNDILKRDLTNTTIDAVCTVTSGQLLDPYTAATVLYTSAATASTVAVDAVVALKAAWAQGANSWDAAKRQTFANDPFNLLTVESKASDLRNSTGSAWMPPNNTFDCAYVGRRIAVEAKYSLTITGAEKIADAGVLSSCPQQKLPDDTAALKAAADKQAADVAAAAAAQAAADKAAADKAAADQAASDKAAADQAAADKAAADAAAAQAAADQAAADKAAADKAAADKAAADQVAADAAAANAAAPPAAPAAPQGIPAYKNCAAVRAAHADPIYAGQPGFSPKLDGDGDGIACEKK